jgi:hypothetical protein
MKLSADLLDLIYLTASKRLKKFNNRKIIPTSKGFDRPDRSRSRGKTAFLLNRYPWFKTGELHTVACFDQRRLPANWFNKIRKPNNKRQVA